MPTSFLCFCMSDPNNAMSLLRQIKEVNLHLTVNLSKRSEHSSRVENLSFAFTISRPVFYWRIAFVRRSNRCQNLAAFRVDDHVQAVYYTLHHVVSYLLISYNTTIKMPAVRLIPERI